MACWIALSSGDEERKLPVSGTSLRTKWAVRAPCVGCPGKPVSCTYRKPMLTNLRRQGWVGGARGLTPTPAAPGSQHRPCPQTPVVCG